MKHLFFLLGVGVLMLVGSGCGSGNVKLSGKVTFSDDKTPLTIGTVCFESASTLSRGDLDQTGSYTLGSLKDADGLPPGEYKVYISGAMEMTPGKMGAGFKPLVDPKYTRAASTPIVANVDRHTKTFDFQIDR